MIVKVLIPRCRCFVRLVFVNEKERLEYERGWSTLEAVVMSVLRRRRRTSLAAKRSLNSFPSPTTTPAAIGCMRRMCSGLIPALRCNSRIPWTQEYTGNSERYALGRTSQSTRGHQTLLEVMGEVLLEQFVILPLHAQLPEDVILYIGAKDSFTARHLKVLMSHR